MEGRHLVHLVEYLNSSLAHTEENGEIAIITIRPDKGSFRPHNVALPIAQAKRLLTDLQRILAPATLAICVLLTGCSTRVEVTREQLAPPPEQAAARTNVVVAVDVLAQPNPQAPPAPERDPPQQENAANVRGDSNAVMNVGGDLHVHQHFHNHTHIHVAPQIVEPPPKSLRVEVHYQTTDPRCERLLREHEQRVAAWKEMMSRQ